MDTATDKAQPALAAIDRLPELLDDVVPDPVAAWQAANFEQLGSPRDRELHGLAAEAADPYGAVVRRAVLAQELARSR